MTKDQEDKIIAQAQDILAKRMAVEKDIKINLHQLVFYAAYYQGARLAITLMEDYARKTFRGDEKVYLEAELRLITNSLRSTQLFLEGCQFGYRNHERDKKGKLIRCDAFFMERKTILSEVV